MYLQLLFAIALLLVGISITFFARFLRKKGDA